MQKRKVILILGTTGSGKSTLTRTLIQRSTRKITLDPLAEYSGTVFYNFLDLYNYIKEKNLRDSGSMNIVYRSTNEADNEMIFSLSRTMTNFLLVVEEAEIYLDPRNLNEDFSWLINYGRHNNISLLCIARRVPEINIGFRAMMTSIISFRQVEPRDLGYLEDYGIEPDEVSTLPDHEYIIHGVDTTIEAIQFE